MNDVKKSIECFESPAKHIKCVHKCENGMEFLTYSADLVADFEDAISALGKQIMKKPLHTEDREFYLCPCCDGKGLRFKQKYCDNCGQAIDWSEES